MRRIRPTKSKLERLMAAKKVGAGVIVTAATAGAIYAWLFRGAPQPGVVVVRPPGPVQIDLLQEWDRHIIIAGLDGTGQPDGADGVDVRDIDGDGLPEVATGHEQGLRMTVAKHPGIASVRAPWSFVTLGASPNLCNPEDAVFGDLDADGNIDAVAACETGSVSLEAFFAPTPPTSILTAGNWDRETLPNSAAKSAMRIQIVDIAGDSMPEIVVGGKERSGPCRHTSVGYYESSGDPRVGSTWTHVEIEPAGWVMQLYVQDVNNDGRKDIVYSDRERIDCDFADVAGIDNTKRGIRWLENLGGDPPAFADHPITVVEGDWKWFHLVDWEGDGDLDVVGCASSPTTNKSEIWINQGGFALWSNIPVTQPSNVGQCQHATAYDLDQDFIRDIQFSYSNAPELSGVVWQKNVGSHLVPSWARGEISGVHTPADGPDIKFDNMAWVDLDVDGDLDVVTTEQHAIDGNGPGFGVDWYENPLGPAPATPLPDAAPPAGRDTIVASVLTSGSSTTPDGATQATASISPSANCLILAAVQSAQGAGPPPASATGNGLTWEQVATVAFSSGSARRQTVLRAMGASPSAGAVTFDFAGATQSSFSWSILQFCGVNTSGVNGSGAVIQSVTATASATTTITGTLPSPIEHPNNMEVAYTGVDINGALSPDPDWAELTDHAIGAGNQGYSSQTATEQDVCTSTFATAGSSILMLEIKAGTL
jgi:hypothetical protein